MSCPLSYLGEPSQAFNYYSLIQYLRKVGERKEMRGREGRVLYYLSRIVACIITTVMVYSLHDCDPVKA